MAMGTDLYKTPDPGLWTGRSSGQGLYLHEKVSCIPFDEVHALPSGKKFAILGYACDEGVKRNQGRPGADEGPDAIRKALAKMPDHVKEDTLLLDVGSVHCLGGDLEATQKALCDKVSRLLENRIFPIVLGGGHDMAYGHYNGIKKYLGKGKTIGILNFDTHFDLRSNAKGNNSGTPFYQVAGDCKRDGTPFNYLCLGIRKDANDRLLFQTAKDFGATYMENARFNLFHQKEIEKTARQFLDAVDHVYVTIDLDGFSSAYAPGVSAAYPTGFAPDIVFETLRIIMDSQKLISLDIAEMNPKYDRDDQTAKLAAGLVHFVVHGL